MLSLTTPFESRPYDLHSYCLFASPRLFDVILLIPGMSDMFLTLLSSMKRIMQLALPFFAFLFIFASMGMSVFGQDM